MTATEWRSFFIFTGIKLTMEKTIPPIISDKKPVDQLQADLFQRCEKFLERNQTKVICVFLLMSLVFSFFLFDIKISEGGDDASYIQRGWYFITKNKFPFYQGPLYPLVLAVPLALFGLNLLVLKLLSVLFTLGSIWFTYLAFRKRIPYVILFSLIFFLVSNSYIQYYASQTYTEAFFLFLQAVSIYFVMKVADSMPAVGQTVENRKISYSGFLWIGIFFTLLSLTKSIAVVCIIPVILFFIFYRNYKYAICTLMSFLIFKIAVELGIRIFYEGGSGQLQQMFLKDLHKPELGYEDFSGIIVRFFANAQHFISVSFYKIMHLRNDLADQPIGFLALMTAVVLVAIIIISYKKNRYIFLVGLYFIVLCASIFGGIQADNKQDRLVLIAMPFIFTIFIYGIYYLTVKFSIPRFYFLGFILIVLSINLFGTVKNSVKNVKVLNKNIEGDKYYGYTDDWVNFLRMSAYCADSLPKSSFIVSRKPSMSFIYGKGKEFYPVYVAFSTDPDTILAKFKDEKVTHIIRGYLRDDPKVNNGKITETIDCLLSPIMLKYPKKMTLIKQIGKSEPAYLYKINYEE